MPALPIAAAIDGQRGHLFPWCPVFYGLGIGAYFALPAEPGGPALAVLAAAMALCLGWARWRREAVLPLALALVVAGVLTGALRTAQVAAPVLEGRYYGPVEGRIVAVDRSLSDKPRLTLDRVVLDRRAPDRTPERVRVSLHGAQDWFAPVPGTTVVMTAHLSPPRPPTEPGGFDFQRHAYFKRLGAVGYTRTPVLELEPPSGARLGQLRARIASALRAALPGDTGAFAAAITAGDRSGLHRATLDALRASNLAHLLAISGLHMGLLTGFVFALLRAGLALWPRVALGGDTRKIAALGALPVAAFYLALSGGNVATERAFVMAAVVLLAVLLDRRAFTLRAVAVAALIVLALRPEALLSPGFQMSFAATTALVAAFGALRDLPGPGLPAWARPASALVVSSAVAGAATAPFAAAHFNIFAHYGLVANLAAVPLMGLAVIPLVVLAGLLAPLGLAGLALWPLGRAIDWIIGVAHTVAGLDGAVRGVPAPGPEVLPLLSLGALAVVLWQGRARWAGLAPVVAALALWAVQERPAVLVADSGRLVGWMTPEGRRLSRARGEGFVARSWLENDGDRIAPAVAFARAPTGPNDDDNNDSAGAVARVRVLDDPADAPAACAAGAVLVSARAVDWQGPCTILDPDVLAASGALAIASDGRVQSVAASRGARPWMPRPRGNASGRAPVAVLQAELQADKGAPRRQPLPAVGQ